MWMRRVISLFFIFFEWAARARGEGGGAARLLNTDHRLRFVTVLWIARGFYPNDIIPLLAEQTPRLLED